MRNNRITVNSTSNVYVPCDQVTHFFSDVHGEINCTYIKSFQSDCICSNGQRKILLSPRKVYFYLDRNPVRLCLLESKWLYNVFPCIAVYTIYAYINMFDRYTVCIFNFIISSMPQYKIYIYFNITMIY
jgi:hypothetical protein